MVKCCICGLHFKRITNLHLNKRHGISTPEFSKRFPGADRGLFTWNTGESKDTHPSLMKLSRRLACQNRWNFSHWQQLRKEKLKSAYPEQLNRNGDLAELIGIILGDGNLSHYPRTESLRIVCNSAQQSYIEHIVKLIEKVLNKRPVVSKRKHEKAIDIRIYQCGLSRRLDIPCGNKIKNNVTIPKWIKSSKIYSINCLKGLFETDGCFQKDKANYAQYIEFKNLCSNLLHDVYRMIKNLGYHPQLGKTYVRLARRIEVSNFNSLIKFRNY